LTFSFRGVERVEFSVNLPFYCFCCAAEEEREFDHFIDWLRSGGMLTDDSVGSTAELGDEDRSVSGDSLSEWRSCNQVDNGTPSTSPPFWDTDGEDDDPGAQLNLLGTINLTSKDSNSVKKILDILCGKKNK
jgi:hypothetical protein